MKKRYTGWSGHQKDMQRFNHNCQITSLLTTWQITQEELEYWKERAIKAESLNSKLFEQCKKLAQKT